MRALRADNARLEARLERIERRADLAQAPRAAPAPPASAPAPVVKADSPFDALPPLTVVKLKPRKDPAPRIDTGVVVVEPPAEVVDELRDARAGASAASEADASQLAIADAQFERALDAMKTGNAEGGVQAMQQFVAEWPRHPRADNALYFAGVGYLSEGAIEAAASAFQRVLAEYPAGDAVLEAMLKLADCRLKLKQPREAKSAWERIIQTYPGTAAAAQAQARLSSHSAALAASP